MVWDDETEEKQLDKAYSSVEPSKTNIPVSNLLTRQSILLFSQPKVGKTYAVCSFIEQTIKQGGRIKYINTDNGLHKTLKAYFKEKYDETLKSIDYYFITDLAEVDDIILKIKNEVKPNDLVCIDLVDDFWEMSQTRFVQDVCKVMDVSIVDYIISASKDDKKFGVLDGSKWNYAKKFDDIILRSLVINPPCNVIACASAKDTDVAKAFAKKDAEKMYELSKYDEIGSRPGGSKILMSKFNTIVYIGELKSGRRFFIMMGDRGYMKAKDRVEYDNNFYAAFMETRK